MISGFSYLTQTQENKWIYYAAGQSWQVWNKPDGCNMIHIAVIGAGAGGGGGYQHAAGATGGGGGGGAASGVYTMMIPAYVLPDKLYIQVGVGGVGGANLAAGAVGGITYIGLIPNTITSANLLISNSFGTGGGGAGSATGGSGGGTSGISWTLTLTGWGVTVQTVAAQAGQAGTGVTALDQTRIVGGGAGGAFSSTGATLAGNSVTSAYKQPSSVTYSAAQPTTGGITKAGNGPRLMSPQPQFFGGAGGASFSTTTAANGGDGDIGCGGGGAGPNLTGGSSTGGRGGDGMVIITCW